MSVTAPRAAMITARTALVANGTFSARIRRDMAEASLTMPFVIMTHISGGTIYEHQGDPVNQRIRFMVVAATQAAADSGISTVESVLNKKGTQQVSSGALNGGSDWEIVITRKVDDLAPPPEMDENREIYRAGLDMDFKLERKS